MNKTLNRKPALVLIDIQDGFDDPYWGKRNNPDAEQNAAKLLREWRALKLPIFHIQHLSTEPESPLRPGQPGSKLKDLVRPQGLEAVLTKNVNSAFIGTGLERRLHDAGISELVIAGLTTDHCVSTTTRMAGNLGFNTFIVSDACATFEKEGPDGRRWSADDLHSSALASLHNEFACAVKTEEMLTMLKESCAVQK